MELLLAAQQFGGAVLTDVLPHVSNSATIVQHIPDVAANVAAATPGMPDMPMTQEIIDAVDRQLELLDRISRQIKELYLSEGRPPVSSEGEYKIMANMTVDGDEATSVKKYTSVLRSLQRLGTRSRFYLKATEFWTP